MASSTICEYLYLEKTICNYLGFNHVEDDELQGKEEADAPDGHVRDSDEVVLAAD
jgi:hypothetical protein